MLSEEDLGKIWGLDHRQRICLKASPMTSHQTDLWVDAGETWVGNLSIEALNWSQKYQGSFWVCRVSLWRFFQKELLIKRGIAPEQKTKAC